MSRITKKNKWLPEDAPRISLSDRQFDEIRTSRLDLARGRFIEHKLFEKEVKLWLKNK